MSKALSSFQGEIKNPTNTADNPFYKSKYSPLHEILNEIRPVMAKYGLSVIQSPGGNGKDISITTMLLHSSGEWIKFSPLIITAEKTTPQGAGSAITYGRRYTISALLGISSENDDDGNIYESSLEKMKSDKQAIKCNECITDIKATPKMGIKEVVSFSKKEFGKELCADCATKKLRERKLTQEGEKNE